MTKDRIAGFPIMTDGVLPLPIANHLSSSALLPHVGFTLPAAIPWMYCLWAPRTLLGGHMSAVSFFKHSRGSTQIHSKPAGNFSFSFSAGSIEFRGMAAKRAGGEKKKKGICCLPIRLMFVPAEHSTSLSLCKDSQGMLKKKKSPTRATQKDFWTHSRDLWPNYFIYYISFFVILTTYIFTFKK